MLLNHNDKTLNFDFFGSLCQNKTLNKAKAISAELFELHLEVQLYNPVVYLTNLVISKANSSQN